MKKLVLSLLGAATMALSSSAMALNTVAAYQAFITQGPVPVPVGTLLFEFSADVPGHLCQYAAEWDNFAVFPLSAECFFDEAKTHGNFSCLDNSLRPVPSIITQDPHFPCTGFDYFQQFRQVFVVMLGEDLNNTLQGLIQFTGAVPIVYGFDAHP